ncbi:hypothetical protein DXV75_00070 [Alteromonas aestuariivivens]|uniref:Uncharacterized protein n=1 Tax=Alteromonas aestuariivivens TaxID=1938339 RepID=A0A3D8MDT1_9ALTE|nr:hypothetical protein DXV75_00070 [Alteromonas aestuariivivens]
MPRSNFSQLQICKINVRHLNRKNFFAAKSDAGLVELQGLQSSFNIFLIPLNILFSSAPSRLFLSLYPSQKAPVHDSKNNNCIELVLA